MSGWYIVNERARTLHRSKNSNDRTQWLDIAEVRCFLRCGYEYKGRSEQPCEDLASLSACIEFLGVPEGAL